MKQMLLMALALTSFTIQANELNTFNDIADAVNQGKIIRFVMNFKECKSEKPLGSATSLVIPNAVMVIDNNRITASDKHFTLDNPSSLGNPTFDFSKFNIHADGSTSIKITVMDAISYEKLSGFQINCKLREGFKVFS